MIYYFIDGVTFREVVIIGKPKESIKVLVKDINNNETFVTLEGNLIPDINDAIDEIEIMIADLRESHKKALEVHRKQTEEPQK